MRVHPIENDVQRDLVERLLAHYETAILEARTMIIAATSPAEKADIDNLVASILAGVEFDAAVLRGMLDVYDKAKAKAKDEGR